MFYPGEIIISEKRIVIEDPHSRDKQVSCFVMVWSIAPSGSKRPPPVVSPIAAIKSRGHIFQKRGLPTSARFGQCCFCAHSIPEKRKKTRVYSCKGVNGLQRSTVKHSFTTISSADSISSEVISRSFIIKCFQRLQPLPVKERRAIISCADRGELSSRNEE